MAERNWPFLGTGWSFPPTFRDHGGALDVVSGTDNVHKCIQIILRTDLGERVLRENFGASLKRYQFEPVTQRLLNRVREVVSNAILRHEPRVSLDRVDVSQDDSTDGLLLIELQYTVLATNSRFNMVYPYYLNEADAT
jgi:uncharacterized protein